MLHKEMIGTEPNIQFKRLGEDTIGEKAQNLIRNINFLEQLDFHIPPTLAVGFDRILKLFPDPDIQNLLFNGKDSPLIGEIIIGATINLNQDITSWVSEYGGAFVAVRSSHLLESGGNGIYMTDFCQNNPDGLIWSIRQVLSGYFSEAAIFYRKRQNIPPRFGLLIQPVIGQPLTLSNQENHQKTIFAPVLSGYAVSSSPSDRTKEAVIGIVPGLGCGVEDSLVELIRFSESAAFGHKYSEYIDHHLKEIRGSYIFRSSRILKSVNPWLLGRYEYLIEGIVPSDNSVDITESVVNLANQKEAIDNLSLDWLFERLIKLEQNNDKPQYIEWLMTVENKQPIFWIVQIADAGMYPIIPSKRLTDYLSPYEGKLLSYGEKSSETGVFPADLAVLANEKTDIADLEIFNQNNRKYILFYPAVLTSKSSEIQLCLRHVSNTAGLIEFNSKLHAHSPLAHWQGTLSENHIPFGACYPHYDYDNLASLFRQNGAKTENGLLVLHKPVQAVFDQKTNQFIISIP